MTPQIKSCLDEWKRLAENAAEGPWEWQNREGYSFDSKKRWLDPRSLSNSSTDVILADDYYMEVRPEEGKNEQRNKKGN